MTMNTLLFIGGLGGWEVLLIVAIVLILFGAKKIPELARGLGTGIREFKNATLELNKEEKETPPATSATKSPTTSSTTSPTKSPTKSTAEPPATTASTAKPPTESPTPPPAASVENQPEVTQVEEEEKEQKQSGHIPS